MNIEATYSIHGNVYHKIFKNPFSIHFLEVYKPMYTVKVVVMRKNQMKECVERTKEKSTKCTLSLSEVLKSWQKAIDGAIEQWLKWR
jgi:hypothetical protein